MKHNIFQNGQTWRLITLCLCITMVVVMLIPGVCPTLTRYISGDEYFDAGNYLRPNSWSIFFCWAAFAVSCLYLLLSLFGYFSKTNTPIQAFISQLIVLYFIGLVFYCDDPLQFWKDGYYLPIVPPILAVCIIISAFLGSYWDKQNAQQRRRLIKKIGVVLLSLICILGAFFVVSRYSRYTTYIPFTGRIFDVEPDEVRRIRVGNGSTGVQLDFSTEEELEEICGILNDLRYQFCFPDIPIPAGGWTYCVFLDTQDHHTYLYEFTSDSLLCRGFWFQLTPETLAPLLEYVEP